MTHVSSRLPSPSARVFLLFLALTILHTWPLASAPHRLSLNHNADAQLNAWIVSWIAHVLPTSPRSFWQGNIFQPGEAALTFSEPLVVPALAGAPLFWVSGSAVLTFNVLLIAGLAATAWTGWWVVRAWTGSAAAGLAAGCLVAFNAHLLTRLPHLQAAHAWGLLLVWWTTSEVLQARGRWWWIALAVASVAATSLHWLVFAVIGAAVMTLVAWPRVTMLVRVTGGGVAGVLLALPVLWPHLTNGVRRPLSHVADFSATLGGYLTSTSGLHDGWSARFFTTDVNVFFPGVLPLLAAALGLGVVWHTRRADGAPVLAPFLARWALALLVMGVVLSLGTATPVYGWLHAAFPPLQGIRAAARFGMLALISIAIFASVGVAWIHARLHGRRAHLVTALVLLGITIEQIHAPIRTTPFHGVPAVYLWLRDESAPVLLVEVPFYPADEVFENGEYVLNATGHWRPVMNGYSGLTPLSYRRHAESFWSFPAPWAVDAIREAGATHVMVHLERFGAEAPAVIRTLEGRPDLRLTAADRDGHRLYRVVRE